MSQPSFTVGIEEEYLLVDADSRDLIREAPPTMLAACQRALEGRVAPEFLQCQIEVGTRVCGSIAEARNDLAHLRKTVSRVARDHGLAMIACPLPYPPGPLTVASRPVLGRLKVEGRRASERGSWGL